MILFPFFSSFFSPFSRGVRGFCFGVGAQSSAKHGGERVCPLFSLANAGGSALGATYLRQTRGAEGFSAHFLGGVFGSSVPFLFLEGWASEKEAAEATRAEELGSEEAEEQEGKKKEEEEE